jgi:hypothetical protein
MHIKPNTKTKIKPKPDIVKNLESFAHRYPIDKVVKNKTIKVPDPIVLQDAQRISDYISNKEQNPTDHPTTW